MVAAAMTFLTAPRTCWAAPKKKPAANQLPQLVICASQHSEPCKNLQRRLASDPSVVPLAQRFRIFYFDVDNDPQRNAFVNQFEVKGLIEPPVLGFASPDGASIQVVRGAPQGEALPQLLTEVLTKWGPKPDNPVVVKAKTPPAAEPRLVALREARKLLKEKRIAAAVEIVAPHVSTPRRSDLLESLIQTLEKQGREMAAAASESLKQPQGLAVGTVALVKAQRLYGKLPTVRKEIDEGWEIVGKSPRGDEIRKQAEAVDKGRALDEAGQAAAALEVYRKVVALYPNTQVAAMASKRIEHLQQPAKK